MTEHSIPAQPTREQRLAEAAKFALTKMICLVHGSWCHDLSRSCECAACVAYVALRAALGPEEGA